MKKILFLLMAVALCHLPVFAQNKTISGTVFDEMGQPMPGVSLLIKGTSTGTVTNMNGKFTLEAIVGQSLLISFIGYQSQEIAIGEQTDLTVNMVLDIKSLEEVVVVGYGSVKKSDLTGSVGVVDTDNLKQFPVSNLASSIQGRLSGVQVVNAAEPGTNPRILVRGYGTIFGDPNPLVVIDGVQTGTGALATLNPNDIESMQVLKDASAAAIYGARAANGVIIITTKSGVKDRIQVDVSSEVGVQQVANQFELMSTEQYAQYTALLYENSSSRFVPVRAPAWTSNPQVLSNNTDWQDVIFRNALLQQYNLGIQGGGEFGTFFLGVGYLKQEGVIVNTDFERINFRINTNMKYGKFKIGESLNFSVRGKPQNELSNSPERAYSVAPQIPIYDETNLNGLGAPLPDRTGGNNLANPLAYNFRSFYTDTYGLLGNIYAEYEFIKGLSFRSDLNVDFSNSHFERYYEPIDQSQASITSTSYQVDLRNNTSLSLNSENYFKFNREFGQHSVQAVLGATGIRNSFVGAISSGTNIEPGTRVPQTGTTTNGSGSNEINTLLSQLGRVNYSYKDRYLLTASLRRDGASNFGRNNRWGYFPSFSLGWRISEEAFLSSAEWLASLKVRGGYGELGRNLGTFRNTLNSEIRYPWATGNISGTGPVGIPNENLRWETVRQFNFGVDAEFFQGKLAFTADYFIRQSDDMIIQVPLPQYTGLPASAWVNLGSMTNNGYELDLRYKTIGEGGFNQSFGINATFIQNEITSLNSSQDTLLNNGTITTSGFPVAAHYGWLVEGVNPTNGQLAFRDLNGDNRVTGADRQVLGSPHPDAFFGFSYQASFKGFDLSLFFQGVVGNQIMNDARANLASTHRDRNRLASVLTDAWDAETNPDGKEPIISLRNENDNDRISDRWIENGDYIRLRNVQLGYAFPESLAKKIHLRSLRVYANAINVFVLTNYSGLDPDISAGSGVFALGRDSFSYPPTRSFNFGIQMGL